MALKDLEKKITQLEAKIKQLETKQLKFPLDPASVQALGQMFFSNYFEKFNVARIFLTTGRSVDPSVEGEILYNATVPSLKVFVGGAVKTITLA